MKFLLRLILLLVILGGGLMAYTYYRANNAPHVGEDFARLAPAQQKERRVEAKQLQEQVKEIASASRRGEKKPFKLTASEAQLNTLLQDNLRGKNVPISNLRAGLTPGELALQGRVLYQGFDATVTMGGSIAVENNKLRYDVKSLQIGGFPAPSSLRDKAEQQVSSRLNKWLAQTPGRIERVQIETGKLTIEGTTR
ncbi:MAG TPA: LmeA family phospholipid-binding protein [Abditibacteriaceae bacterium]